MSQPQKPPSQGPVSASHPPVAAAISDAPSPGSSSPSDDGSSESGESGPENRLSHQLDEAENRHVSKMEENVRRQREMNNAGKDWRKMNKERIKKVKTGARKDYHRNALKIKEQKITLAAQECQLTTHESQLGTHEDQLTAQACLLTNHGRQLTAHEGRLAAQANLLDDHEKNQKSHHDRIAKIEAGHGKHDERLTSIEAKHEEHGEVLEKINKDNKCMRLTLAGIGVTALLGVAIWTLGKIFGKKNGKESAEGKRKDRRHAREWYVVEDYMNNDLYKFRRF